MVGHSDNDFPANSKAPDKSPRHDQGWRVFRDLQRTVCALDGQVVSTATASDGTSSGQAICALARTFRSTASGCNLCFKGARSAQVGKDFRASWADAVERAGLKDSIGLFHDLRRSAARNMVNAGMDEKLAMKIGGWKTDSVFRSYRITPRRDLQRAAEKMNEFFKQERAELQKIVIKK